MGDPALADPALVPDLHWNHDPAWAGDGKTIHVNCDYRLVLDNLMDLTHETFVHGSSIGNEAVAEAPFDVTHGEKTVTVTRWMRGIEPPRSGPGSSAKPDWSTAGRSSASKPRCTIAIDVGVAPTGTGAPEGDRLAGRQRLRAQHHHAETEKTCHYFWAFVRNYQLGEQRITSEIREGVSGIFREDELILEAQQRAMDENPDRIFYNLNIDAGAMWSRKLIDRMVAKETAPQRLQAAE